MSASSAAASFTAGPASGGTSYCTKEAGFRSRTPLHVLRNPAMVDRAECGRYGADGRWKRKKRSVQPGPALQRSRP